LNGADAAIIVAAAFIAAGLGWCGVALRQHTRQLRGLDARVLRVETARKPPVLRLAFHYDAERQIALLHVTNSGPGLELRAPVTVHGALTNVLDRPVFARWAHTADPSARIETAQTGILHLARLQVDFPFAQRHLLLTDAAATPIEAVAARSSVIGGMPQGDDPPLILESAVGPDDASVSPHPYLVVLRPFSAEWMSPTAARPRTVL
jgi:hypothetical protein